MQFFHQQELMAAVTGAIWKCATDSYENVERFEELELMKTLVGILKVILQYLALEFIMRGAKRNIATPL